MRSKLGVVAFALSFALIGCVSTSKYKKLEADRNAVRASDEACKTKAAGLEQDVNALKATNSQLNEEKAALEKQSQQTKSDYDSVLGQLQQEVQEGQLTIRQYKNMLSVDIAEKIFFDSGRAKIKTSGKQVLMKVGEVLAKYPDKLIRVVGYTDNVPVAKSYQAVIPSNWELSVLRATNVVRFLQDEAKIPGERLYAMGRSEYDPVALNDTPEGRQQNRRIEILLIDKQVQQAMESK